MSVPPQHSPVPGGLPAPRGVTPLPPTGATVRPAGSAPRRASRGRVVLRVVGAAVVGLVVGVVGTVMFQAERPWGLVLALAASLAGSITCRAWAGWGTLTAYALGWMIGTGVLAFVEGPGGDVVVPAATLSIVWLVGGVVAVVLPSFLPWRWFADDPDAGRRPGGAGLAS